VSKLSWRPRNLGLLFSAMRVEVEDVKKAHKTVCVTCGRMPKGRRLTVTKGVARSQSREVYCIEDGNEFLSCLAIEVVRARYRLSGRSLCVRIPLNQWPKVEHKRKRAKKQTKPLLKGKPPRKATTIKGVLGKLRDA